MFGGYVIDLLIFLWVSAVLRIYHIYLCNFHRKMSKFFFCTFLYANIKRSHQWPCLEPGDLCHSIYC